MRLFALVLLQRLLEMKPPVAALQDYAADLNPNPNRLNGLRGATQAAAMAGKAAQASQYRAELEKLSAGSQAERCQMEKSHPASGQ